MGKKKKKIAKLTEEQYFAYIAGLKEDAAIVNSNGDLLIPDIFKQNDNNDEKQNF